MSERPRLIDLTEAVEQACNLLEHIDEGENEYDLRELLPSIYRPHCYETDGNRPVGTYECGSIRLDDSAKCLYRVLFLFQPKHLSFADMYKNCVFALCSPDQKLVADVEFYKYELALYFTATEEFIEGRPGVVQSGLPGINNGVSLKEGIGRDWTKLLIELLNRRWDVYPGNNFSV